MGLQKEQKQMVKYKYATQEGGWIGILKIILDIKKNLMQI